jgi:hypothetical protein
MAIYTISMGAGAPVASYNDPDVLVAALPATFTEDNRIRIRHGGSASHKLTKGFNVTGKNFAGFKLIFEAYPGEGYLDRSTLLTTPLRYDPAYGATIEPSGSSRGITVDSGNATSIEIIGLQIASSIPDPYTYNPLRFVGVKDVLIDRCVIFGSDSSYGVQNMGEFIVGTSTGSGVITIRNNLFWRKGYSSWPGATSTLGFSSGYADELAVPIIEIFNNMFISTAGNEASAHGGLNFHQFRKRVHNNAFLVADTTSFSDWGSYLGSNLSIGNNATVKASGASGFIGTGALYSVALSACVQNATAAAFDARLKTGSPLIDVGTSSYGPLTDMYGQARSGADTDIGVYEFPMPEVPVTVTTGPTFSDTTPMVGEPVTVSWATFGSPQENWSLDLNGDGTPEYTGTTQKTTVVYYGAPGTFTATLTASNSENPPGTSAAVGPAIVVSVGDGADYAFTLGDLGVTGTMSVGGGGGGDPEIDVFGNSNAIIDGTATTSVTNHTDFGTVILGGATVQYTYTIQNTGTADLTIGTPTVPTGFTLVTAPGSTVTPSNSTIFVVRLDSATAGLKTGQVSFATNDATENPFNFTITGTVLVPLAYARPAADVLDGGWTNELGSNVNLYASIDETTAIDTDFIRSSVNPVNDACEIAFSALVDPLTGDFHSFSYRAKKNGSATMELTVQVRDGASVIASYFHSDLPTTPTTYNRTLSPSEANAITNYANLRVRFIANRV